MKTTYYDLNRPVHLGRRDAFMEKASEIFHKCLQEVADSKLIQRVDVTLYYLQSAFEHSVLAAKSGQAGPNEESFVLVIRMLVFYLYSVLVVIDNESQLKNKESPLWQFLHGHGKAHVPRDVGQSSKQLLEDVSRFLRIAESPYSDLRKNVLERMNDHDRAQYAKAYQSLKKHIATRSHQRHTVRHGRTSYPALAMKYG